MTIRSVGVELCPMHTQGRTDRHDEDHGRLSQICERSYKVKTVKTRVLDSS